MALPYTIDSSLSLFFEATVLWEYYLALVRTMAADTHQNSRAPVWPGSNIDFLLLHRNILPNDERANTFWKQLYNQVIFNIEKESEAPTDRCVS